MKTLPPPRRIGLSAALSLCLHGMVVVALGVFPWGAAGRPEPLSLMTVDLVDAQPTSVPFKSPAAPLPAAPPAPPPKKARPAVKAKHPHPAPKATPRLHRVQSLPVAVSPDRSPGDLPPLESVWPGSEGSEPMPGFVEMPHSLAPSLPRLAAGSNASRLAEPEPMPVTAALSVSGAVPPLSRPLSVAAAAPARVLRDPAAEGGGVRSKVGPGDNPRPEYPRAAREAGWEGTVVLQVEVLPDGLAGTVGVHKTSGHPLLDEAASRAVQGWRFVPAMDGNFPVRTVVHLPIRFDLRAQN